MYNFLCVSRVGVGGELSICEEVSSSYLSSPSWRNKIIAFLTELNKVNVHFREPLSNIFVTLWLLKNINGGLICKFYFQIALMIPIGSRALMDSVSHTTCYAMVWNIVKMGPMR